jgi:hypothetical protein
MSLVLPPHNRALLDPVVHRPLKNRPVAPRPHKPEAVKFNCAKHFFLQSDASKLFLVNLALVVFVVLNFNRDVQAVKSERVPFYLPAVLLE